MGFTEILTVVFIVLKLLGIVSWSWWLVCLPEIIAVVIYAIIFFATFHSVNKTRKHIEKHFDDFDF